MFMAGVLFMLGCIVAGFAVRLTLSFWPIILTILGMLAVGLAASVYPSQVLPMLILPGALTLVLIFKSVRILMDLKAERRLHRP